MLIYANRTVLSPFLTMLEAQWGMTRSQLGLLNSAFFLMYTLLQVPTGILADRFGRRLLLLPGYLVHAIGATASGLAGGAGGFLAARVVTGIGQSTYYSTQYALASAAIPRRSRALGMAIINSGMAFGIAGGMLAASAALAAGADWRAPFLVLAALTFILTGAFARFVRADQPAVNPQAQPEVVAAPGKAGRRGRMAPISRNVALSYFVAFATMYGFFVILTWLPYYLETQRGLTGATSGLVSTGVAFAAVPAGVLAGRISDRIGKRRPVLLALTPLAGLALTAIVTAPSTPLVFAAIILYGVTGKLVVDPLLVAMVADATPVHAYGTAFGILNFAGTISTVLAPAVTGMIADWSGSFTTAFLLAAGLQLVASLCILVMQPEGTAIQTSRPGAAGEAA
jgi:MFS family permease